MTTERINKLNEHVKQIVSKIITQELSDPRIGFVTVTTVKLSKDLQHLKIFVSILGDETERKKNMRCLKHARGYIQHELSNKIRMKYTPKISFHYDKSIEKNIRLAKILKKNKIEEDDEPFESGGEGDVNEDEN